MSAKVITFGEIMLRLSTPGYRRFIQAESFEVKYGGGEANVAASLAQFGMEAYFVTKVPENPIGCSAVNYLRRYGVKTDHIIRGGERLGVYFLETGVSQRPSVVVYDRAGSAIAEALPGEFSWPEIFQNSAWFHFTGITPALSDRAAQSTLAACKVAAGMGIPISCDLNYRKKLWSEEKAQEVMSGLMPYIDVVIANEEDAEKVFGIQADNSDVEKGELSDQGFRRVAHRLYERFRISYVAITLRESYSASDNGWSALLYDGRDYFHSRKYRIHLVDRIGGGDSLGAGLIYGLLQKWPSREIIEFATAASCLKHTVWGDFNMISVDEVRQLARGDGSGRVQR